ncbi:MAG TPA: hypothetical protein VGI91_09605 [Steroidobacteraceae bacterium]
MPLKTVLAWVGMSGLIGSAATAAPGETSDLEVTARLVHERHVFIARADAEGYRVCPAPQIKLADPASFGRFDPETNTVFVATWSRLSAAQRERFGSLAEHSGGGASAEAMFAEGTYGWVFVHELGHWWQACRKLTRVHSYGAEGGANRIALAFWREQDPELAARILDTFRYLQAAIASPVPAGMPKEQYLDDHFLLVAESRGYTWYQADMTLELAAESPRPSFHKALSQPLYPW